MVREDSILPSNLVNLIEKTLRICISFPKIEQFSKIWIIDNFVTEIVAGTFMYFKSFIIVDILL